ncbi:TMG1 protein, partial [Amia calva]|nr:TMG1 protein [Amia calva]
MGGSLFHSVYLIVPLLAGLLLIIIVLVALWRCHSRKLFQRGSTFSQRREAAGRRDRHLSLVGMDQRGHSSYHPDISPQSDLSTNSGVTGGFSAYVGSDLTPGRLSNGDPPPSYEEAMGHTDVRIEAGDIHTDPPPQYDEIMTACSGPGVIIGHVK